MDELFVPVRHPALKSKRCRVAAMFSFVGAAGLAYQIKFDAFTDQFVGHCHASGCLLFQPLLNLAWPVFPAFLLMVSVAFLFSYSTRDGNRLGLTLTDAGFLNDSDFLPSHLVCWTQVRDIRPGYDGSIGEFIAVDLYDEAVEGGSPDLLGQWLRRRNREKFATDAVIQMRKVEGVRDQIISSMKRRCKAAASHRA